ncbi:YdbH domain-containing protein [Shewanella algidipiscicola]|uniref:Dicarboxylate transport domain-containing protein n=1 Tax=Shewanella algidipiscicola TaxID=614070 RepID=A0ABQ4PLH9_9GAMM|nr:YdbH domain-containing protein [Shewanella algidipiscicola]GIU48945.1 hypothetical protein TUM4630_26420 [Shewanella algidipiscicola]
MWQRLSQSRLMAALLIAALLVVVALSLVVVNLSGITQSLANRYLLPANTQISALNVGLDGVLNGHIARLDLQVNDSHIAISDLQLTFDDAVEWTHFSLEHIDTLAIRRIEVLLSPTLFYPRPSTEFAPTTSPALSFDMAALPKIAIGQTQLSVQQIPSEQLSLRLDYLNIDNQGRVTSQLSHHDKFLFGLDAQLSDKSWQFDTRLSLDTLQTFMTQWIASAPAQQQDTPPLRQFIALKHQLDTQHIDVSGQLISSTRLDIAKARIDSSHQLEPFSLTLNGLAGTVLSSPLQLVPKALPVEGGADSTSVSTPSNSLPSNSIAFEITGPVSDLSVNLAPTQLELAISPLQRQAFYSGATTLAPLLNSLDRLLSTTALSESNVADNNSADNHRPPSPPAQDTLDSQQSLRTQHGEQTGDVLTGQPLYLTLRLASPLSYQINSQQLSIDHLQAELSWGNLQLNTELKHLNSVKKNDETTITTDWQLTLLLPSSLCVDLLTQQEDPAPIAPCDTRKELQLRADEVALSATGSASATSPTAALAASSFALTVQPNAQLIIDGPNYRHQSLDVASTRFTLALIEPLRFNIADAVKLQFGHIDIGSSDNQFTFTHAGEQYQLASERSSLQLNGGHFSRQTSGASQWLLHPLTIATVNPQLSQFSETITAPPTTTLTSSELMLSSKAALRLHLAAKRDDTTPLLTGVAARVATSPANTVTFNQQLVASVTSPAPPQADSSATQLYLPPLTLQLKATQLTQQRMNEQQQTIATTTNIGAAHLNMGAVDMQPAASSAVNISPADNKGITELKNAVANTSVQSKENASSNSLAAQLLNAPWHNQLELKLENVSVNQQYYQFKKRRQRNLFAITQLGLTQQLDWQASASHYRLRTAEQWMAGQLSMRSHQQLTLQKHHDSAALQGEFTHNSDLQQLINQLSSSFALNMPIATIGDIQITSRHQLTWQPDELDFSMQLTPLIQISEGSINLLPFEQVKLAGECHLNANIAQLRPSKHSIACDRLSLQAQAFNPGVVLNNINADSQFNWSSQSASSFKGAGAQLLDSAYININASADTLGGHLLLPKFSLDLHHPSEAYLVLQALDLAQLLAIQPQEGIYADGIFDGVLPLQIVDGKVSVTGGKLAARAQGGLIKVSNNPAVIQMRASQPYLDFAFSALEELHYSELSSRFDMATNGDAVLHVNVKGQAKDIERPIHLNYAQEENMLQLLKSLQIGDRLQQGIEQSMAQ